MLIKKIISMNKRIGVIRVFLVILCLLLGCNIVCRMILWKDVKSDVELVLQSAGDNRNELEKVLFHYQNTPADSLKFKAACYLIKHLPYYYSYAPNEIVDSLKLLKVKNGDQWISKEVINNWKWFQYENLPKINDTGVITADLLIENIEITHLKFGINVHGVNIIALQISVNTFFPIVLVMKN